MARANRWGRIDGELYSEKERIEGEYSMGIIHGEGNKTQSGLTGPNSWGYSMGQGQG